MVEGGDGGVNQHHFAFSLMIIISFVACRFLVLSRKESRLSISFPSISNFRVS